MTAIALPRRRPRRPQPISRLARREAGWGLLFVSPWVLGFLAFTLIPMLATLVFTFTNVNLEQREPLKFVGVDNYTRLVGDQQAWDALWVTLKFALLALPVGVFLPLAVALLLSHRHLRGAGLFRVLFFLPFVVPFVAGVLIWQTMLNPETGWIDVALRTIGIEQPPDWLRDQSWVYAGLVFMGLWGIGGGIVIYLAGLANIPSELYDAARIDGAGYVAQLRNITLPLLSPVVFFTLILGLVEVLQYFLVPLVLNQGTGEPGGSTLFLNLYIYKNFFGYHDLAYGSTIAWFLFGVTLLITLLLFGTARRWVFYAGDR
jgi:multiple sugar transport system permease protein